MLKKLFGLLSLILLSLGSFAFGINTDQGSFGDTGQAGGVNVGGAGQQASNGLVDVVKSIINYGLGLLFLVALIIVLWGGFQMLTAGGDDGKYQKGFTILKQAGIGLIIIGFSWWLVSFIIDMVVKIGG